MKTYEFKDYIKKTFYRPSRNHMLPGYRMRAFSRTAIFRLWDTKEFRVGERIYSNEEIRFLLAKRMMPEHLDTAIKIFLKINREFGLEILMYLIMVCIINQNGLMVLLAEYDLKEDNNLKKGGIA